MDFIHRVGNSLWISFQLGLLVALCWIILTKGVIPALTGYNWGKRPWYATLEEAVEDFGDRLIWPLTTITAVYGLIIGFLYGSIRR